jgi:hypothetical protein
MTKKGYKIPSLKIKHERFVYLSCFMYTTEHYKNTTLIIRHLILEVKLRPTVSRPIRLGVRHPSGTLDQIFFRHFRLCYFVASSLTRGRVCNLLLLLVLASTVPWASRPYFIVPILEAPPTWRARSLYLYSPGQRGRVCNLLLLLALASTVPRAPRQYFIVPILETPPTWRAR